MRATLAAPALLLALPLALAACGGGQARTEDHRINHPIAVARTVSTLALASDGRGGVAADAEGLRRFVVEHARRGHGPVEVRGAPADVAAAARLLAGAGLRAADLLPIPSASGPGGGVTLRFDAHAALPSECGAFASDRDSLFANPHNRVSSEWGCATQRNLGLMISDPADLLRMRGGPSASSSGRFVGRILEYDTYERPEAARAGATASDAR